MKNVADAEDVAQEAFLRAFRHLSIFRAEAKFSTWLKSITLNEARSRLRRQSVIRIASLDEPSNNAISPLLLRDWREIPSEVIEREEVRQLIQQAIEGLPDMYRQVFLLRDAEGFDTNETAQALNINVPTVKGRLHRARIMLQKQLVPQLKTVEARTPKRRWRPW
jgi:RNA polymerase sigma-70 factor (ECF subfamily)